MLVICCSVCQRSFSMHDCTATITGRHLWLCTPPQQRGLLICKVQVLGHQGEVLRMHIAIDTVASLSLDKVNNNKPRQAIHGCAHSHSRCIAADLLSLSLTIVNYTIMHQQSLLKANSLIQYMFDKAIVILMLIAMKSQQQQQHQ